LIQYFANQQSIQTGKPDINPLHLSLGAETQSVMLYLLILLA